jgi:hypothetical protein
MNDRLAFFHAESRKANGMQRRLAVGRALYRLPGAYAALTWPGPETILEGPSLHSLT